MPHVTGAFSRLDMIAGVYFIYRLREVDRQEAGKRRREEARNNLESYLYRVRDLLDDTSAESPFMKCSQESERKTIAEKVEEAMTWLHDRGDLAETSQFYDKKNAVEYAQSFCSRSTLILTRFSGLLRARSFIDTRKSRRSLRH